MPGSVPPFAKVRIVVDSTCPSIIVYLLSSSSLEKAAFQLLVTDDAASFLTWTMPLLLLEI
jgi:hypothetical protein